MNIALKKTIARAANSQQPPVRIVIAGHVDHGKSTLIGRLLHETGTLPEGKLEALKSVSQRRGMPFEWSFLLDSLQSERDQGITIDTSQIRFRTPSRDFVLIDAPGHAEFLRNMITGAAQADAAILIVDATEGVRDQTRRHAYLLHLLGIRQTIALVNKMDRIGFDANRFEEIERELTNYLSELGTTARAVIPISARHGDNIAQRSDKCSWYRGPSVLEALDAFSSTPTSCDLALRIPVQAIYKFDDRRIIAGRVESGSLSIGDHIVIMPGRKSARVKTIEAWPVPDPLRSPNTARAGQSIGITIDRDLFIERGNVIAHAAAPIAAAHTIQARIFWLPQQPLNVGDNVCIRIARSLSSGTVVVIRDAIDPGGLTSVGDNAIGQNQVGEVEIALERAIAADLHSENPVTGRIVIERSGRISGGGLILAHDSKVAPQSALKQTELLSHSRKIPKLSAKLLGGEFSSLPAGDRLARLRHEIVGKITFTTSFGLEDQAITHLIAEQALDIEFVTLDAGRLFAETYEVWARTEQRYGIRIIPFYPDAAALEALIARQGINGFYDSRERRLSCCHVRKVEPLNRSLLASEAWVTGLRADQSQFRGDMSFVSVDEQRGLLKLNPIFDWTRDTLLDFVRTRNIPINSLHGKGFASIGCAPCTRPIATHEPERAGRWWWEQEEKTECGLHLGPKNA